MKRLISLLIVFVFLVSCGEDIVYQPTGEESDLPQQNTNLTQQQINKYLNCLSAPVLMYAWGDGSNELFEQTDLGFIQSAAEKLYFELNGENMPSAEGYTDVNNYIDIVSNFFNSEKGATEQFFKSMDHYNSADNTIQMPQTIGTAMWVQFLDAKISGDTAQAVYYLCGPDGDYYAKGLLDLKAQDEKIIFISNKCEEIEGTEAVVDVNITQTDKYDIITPNWTKLNCEGIKFKEIYGDFALSDDNTLYSIEYLDATKEFTANKVSENIDLFKSDFNRSYEKGLMTLSSDSTNTIYSYDYLNKKLVPVCENIPYEIKIIVGSATFITKDNQLIYIVNENGENKYYNIFDNAVDAVTVNNYTGETAVLTAEGDLFYITAGELEHFADSIKNNTFEKILLESDVKNIEYYVNMHPNGVTFVHCVKNNGEYVCYDLTGRIIKVFETENIKDVRVTAINPSKMFYNMDICIKQFVQNISGNVFIYSQDFSGIIAQLDGMPDSLSNTAFRYEYLNDSGIYNQDMMYLFKLENGEIYYCLAEIFNDALKNYQQNKQNYIDFFTNVKGLWQNENGDVLEFYWEENLDDEYVIPYECRFILNGDRYNISNVENQDGVYILSLDRFYQSTQIPARKAVVDFGEPKDGKIQFSLDNNYAQNEEFVYTG